MTTLSFLNLPTKHGCTRVWHLKWSKSETSDFDAGRSKSASGATPISGGGEPRVTAPLPKALRAFDLPAGGRFNVGACRRSVVQPWELLA
jgi:hypothetical protein